MIKAIIFDCFGVLVTSHWEEFWGSLPTKEVQDKTRELNRTYDGGFITKEEFLNEVNKATGRSSAEVEEVLFGDVNRTKNLKLLEYIKTQLKPKYKIGLLSNIANNWIRHELLTKDEQKLFDDFVFSFEVKMTKPDPRIFELACARLGVAPEQAVMIDDLERYKAAAEEVGMKVVVYKDFMSMKEQLEKTLADSNN